VLRRKFGFSRGCRKSPNLAGREGIWQKPGDSSLLPVIPMRFPAALLPAPGGRLSRSLAIGLLVLVGYLSLTPLPPAPAGLPDHSDLLVHLVMHMVLAGSIFLGLPRRGRARWGVALLLALVLELAQLWIPGRSFDGLDLGANLLGAVLGGGLMQWLIRSRGPRVNSC
jgi:VanZ family protein